MVNIHDVHIQKMTVVLLDQTKGSYKSSILLLMLPKSGHLRKTVRAGGAMQYVPQALSDL